MFKAKRKQSLISGQEKPGDKLNGWLKQGNTITVKSFWQSFLFYITVLNQQVFLRSDVNTDKTSMTRVMQKTNHCLIFAFRAANASCSRSSPGATFLMSVHSEYFVYLRKMFVAEAVRTFSSSHSSYYGFKHQQGQVRQMVSEIHADFSSTKKERVLILCPVHTGI